MGDGLLAEFGSIVDAVECAATIQAGVVPSNVIEACRSAIPLIKTVASKGNRNSVSDAGVAAMLLKTASEGAYLNVMTNCSSLSNKTIPLRLGMSNASLSNKTYAAEFLKKSEVAFNEVEIQVKEVLSDIKKMLVNI